ncbi:MAG: hypothetical protein R3F13_11725 [Prosthecobacter sp.]
MDDGKFWPALIVLALAVGGIFAFRYFEMYDKANAAAINARSAINLATEALNFRRDMWGRVGTLIQEIAEANDRAQKAQAEADTKERMVSSDLTYLSKAMKEKVEAVRLEATKSEIAAVALRNGKTLRNAKIKKIDDESATFLHSEGVITVAVSDLPSELVEKFDLGAESIVRQLERLERDLGSKIDAPVVDTSDLLRVRKRIAQITVQLEHATKHKDKLEKEVTDYGEEMKKAEAKGIPTTNISSMRDIAEGNAGMARIQLRQLQTELEKLKVEEAALSKKK